MPRYAILLLLTLSLTAPLVAQIPAGFVLEEENDGVLVYLREEADGEMSVLARTEATSTVVRALHILNDVTAYPVWVHRCAVAEQLPGGTADGFSYRSVIDLPFPFRDREVVARITQETSGDGRQFTRHITSTPEAIPPTEGTSRMEVYEADWLVETGGRRSAGAEFITLQCIVRTDAGSGLPGWLRREILTGGPVKTMVNLRGLCEK